jgi:nucleoside permease NupC
VLISVNAQRIPINLILFHEIMQFIMAIMFLLVIMALRDLNTTMNNVNKLISSHEVRIHNLEYRNGQVP